MVRDDPARSRSATIPGRQANRPVGAGGIGYANRAEPHGMVPAHRWQYCDLGSWLSSAGRAIHVADLLGPRFRFVPGLGRTADPRAFRNPAAKIRRRCGLPAQAWGKGRLPACKGSKRLPPNWARLWSKPKYRNPDKPVSGSYEGEGFIIVRHPETKVVEQALNRIIGTVKVEMGA